MRAPSKPAYVAAARGVRCALPRLRPRRPASPTRRIAATRHPMRRPEQLLALHRHLGISRGVLVQASCARPPRTAHCSTPFRAIRGTTAASRWCSTAITDDGAARPARARRARRALQLRATPGRRAGRSTAVGRMAERIAALGWHLVLHLDAENLVEFRGLPRRPADPLRHRPHGAHRRARRTEPAALPRTARPPGQRARLGEGERRRPGLVDAGRLPRRGALRARGSSRPHRTGSSGAPTGRIRTSAKCPTTGASWT